MLTPTSPYDYARLLGATDRVPRTRTRPSGSRIRRLTRDRSGR
jgi:hypothetical protein